MADGTTGAPHGRSDSTQGDTSAKRLCLKRSDAAKAADDASLAASRAAYGAFRDLSQTVKEAGLNAEAANKAVVSAEEAKKAAAKEASKNESDVLVLWTEARGTVETLGLALLLARKPTTAALAQRDEVAYSVAREDEDKASTSLDEAKKEESALCAEYLAAKWASHYATCRF
jgi:hypothetical protein